MTATREPALEAVGLASPSGCILIALVGYRWALRLYNRDPSR
jgi:hypothetical protein